MTEAELVTTFPCLYHMAEADAWPSLRTHGLESTSALLDRFGIVGEPRRPYESQRRSTALPLMHPQWGTLVLRDQRPMVESLLVKCLVGMTPAEWYRLLNRQVFLWPTRERLNRLLGAKFNRTRPHCVLTFDTAALLRQHGPAVRLSPLNSGCTRPPLPRGQDTFLPIADYPFAERCRRRKRTAAIAEVTVNGRVAPLESVLLRVERYVGVEVETILWERTTNVGHETRL
jgi:hypothetical protein